MDASRGSCPGSGNYGDYTPGIAETFPFGEEIQSLMMESVLQHSLDSPQDNDTSFTALLGLPMTQALNLLHMPESGDSTPIPGENPENGEKSVAFSSISCSPTLPSDAALVDQPARFYVFPEESPATSSDPSISSENSLKLKAEPVDSDSIPNSSPIFSTISTEKPRSGEKREGEKGKVKALGVKPLGKKSKSAEVGSSRTREETDGGADKPPYVHVRARRGQATDSHSLAERARREKINARMKLLQELVPGCNKISGTALVLDEIINHVQSLQHQVEFLSMRLAAVDPRTDFSSLNSSFSSEMGGPMASNVGGMFSLEPEVWPEVQASGAGWLLQPSLWERHANHSFMLPETSFIGHESANPSSLHPQQLKMKI